MPTSSDTVSRRFALQYLGDDHTPDGATRYMRFDARAGAQGFTGSCEFEVASADIEDFVRILDGLITTLGGEADLTCGYGSTPSFQLRLSWLDRRGHALLDCSFATTYRDSLLQSARIYQSIEYAQVTELRDYFKASLTAEPGTRFAIDAPA